MSRRPLTTLSVASGFFVASAALAFAASPFLADFESDLHGFFSGQSVVTNPATGGVGGSGYMNLETTFVGNLGAASDGADLTSDLSNIDRVDFWLNDVGTDEALEIHLGVGESFGNFWVSTAGFSPPDGSWAKFGVDLEEANFTQVIGSGTFADALVTCNRLHFRHDTPPIVQPPDTIEGDFGVDNVELVQFSAKVPAATDWALLALAALCAVAGVGVLRRGRPVVTA